MIMSDWIEVGTLNDIPKLGARVVSRAEGDIAVFRTADDKVFALRDKCPHKGGQLSQGIVLGIALHAHYMTGKLVLIMVLLLHLMKVVQQASRLKWKARKSCYL